MIILVDFAGTLIKGEVIEEANKLRSEVLQRALPSSEEHAVPEELYKANREFVEKLTGLTTDMKVQYRENDLDRIEMTGEQVQNQIATNLFQLGMYMSAKKYGKDMVPAGLLEQLQAAKDKGYKLAIVSGVREDIITGMLAIAGIDLFDYIYAQPPRLGISNDQNIADLKSQGEVKFALGDKMSDLEAGKNAGAVTIFVKWGHPSGGEEDFADHTIDSAEQLSDIIQ